jgi:hypothetical protein
VDLLEEERLAASEPEPLDVQRRRAELELEARGDRLASGLGPRRDQPGGRVEAAGMHLVGEAPVATEVQVETAMEDERSAAARSLDALLAGELGQCAPDGDQAAAVLRRELALRRQPVARFPLVGIQSGHKVEIDLVVQRDGTELEPETGHRRAWILLRAARMVITL